MARAATVLAVIGLVVALPAVSRAQAQGGGVGGGAGQPALKIAFISSQQILEQTPGYAAAESTFKKEYQGFQDEAQKLRQQFDSAVQAFEKQSLEIGRASCREG